MSKNAFIRKRRGIVRYHYKDIFILKMPFGCLNWKEFHLLSEQEVHNHG